MAEGGEISNALTDYYQYNGNNVEFCVEIVKQEAADGQGEAADYMVIFALPVSQPCSVLHSASSSGPAAR